MTEHRWRRDRRAGHPLSCLQRHSNPGRNPIAAPSPASWAYTENFVLEDDVLMRARARAQDLGCAPVAPGTGAALSVLAATAAARSVVEIGTGTGVSGVYLLRGMPEDGVLTSIDSEADHQRAARDAFTEAEIRSNRTRLIAGRALEVLPRLADHAYDMVFIDGDRTEYDACLDQALRMLRPGGVLAVDHALWHDRVASPARRDEVTTIIRDLGKRVRDDPRLQPALLPCGDGLLVAVTR